MKRNQALLTAVIIMLIPCFAQAEAKEEYISAGNECLVRGDYACAIENYQKEVQINPSGHALTNLAWVLATAPHKQYRDGQLALDLALKAVDSAERQNILNQNLGYLCALAAAYAENGDFEQAVANMDRVISQAQVEGLPAEVMNIYAEFRQSFYNETPWRLTPSEP